MAKEFLYWFQEYKGEKNRIPVSILSKYFNKSVLFSRNGNIEAKGLSQLETNLSNVFRTKITNFHYLDIIAAKNIVTVYFESTLSYHNLKQNFVFIQIFTFKHGKIQRWDDYFAVAAPLL